MWTFFAPTKAKIGASLIIVGAMWASESLALHVWTFLNADLFAEMGKRFAEQDPQQVARWFKICSPEGGSAAEG